MNYPCRSCEARLDSPKARAAHERIHAVGHSIAERLWSRVDRSGGPDACWPWTGHRVRDGYGRMVVDGKSVGVHRISLSLALGRPILAGHDACHRCDNPPCCNPAHLFEGVRRVNVADRQAKGREAEGSVNGRARLTDEAVRLIRQRFREGASWAAVAAEFHVSKGAIQAIAAGRTWQHVT